MLLAKNNHPSLTVSHRSGKQIGAKAFAEKKKEVPVRLPQF